MTIAEFTRKKIIITRPEQSARSFVDFICTNNGTFQPSDFLISPVLYIEKTYPQMPRHQDYDAVIITSAHAVYVLRDCDAAWRTKNFYVVGRSAETLLQDLGCKNIICVTQTASDMVHMIQNMNIGLSPMRFLYLRGVDVSMDIMGALNDLGYAADQHIVYSAHAEEEITQETRDVIKRRHAEYITFFSKRSAEQFLKLAHQAQLSDMLGTIKALCISDDVLKCVHPVFSPHSVAASSPDRDGMFDVIATNALL